MGIFYEDDPEADAAALEYSSNRKEAAKLARLAYEYEQELNSPQERIDWLQSLDSRPLEEQVRAEMLPKGHIHPEVGPQDMSAPDSPWDRHVAERQGGGPVGTDYQAELQASDARVLAQGLDAPAGYQALLAGQTGRPAAQPAPLAQPAPAPEPVPAVQGPPLPDMGVNPYTFEPSGPPIPEGPRNLYTGEMLNQPMSVIAGQNREGDYIYRDEQGRPFKLSHLGRARDNRLYLDLPNHMDGAPADAGY